MLKKWIFALIFIALFLLILFVTSALIQSKTPLRDTRVLMNKYSQFKQSNPLAAKKALFIVLKQNPNYLPALIESIQWYQNENDSKNLLSTFQRLHHLVPDNNNYTYQLANLYYSEGEWSQAAPLFVQLAKNNTGNLHIQSQHALDAMSSSLPGYPQLVARDIQIVKSPDDVVILPHQIEPREHTATFLLTKPKIGLREKGYIALAQGHKRAAIDYFSRAYAIKPDADVAMQLGYLYDEINLKPQAYRYFQLATRSPDKTLALRAQYALTNLGGLQTKALPSPYFSEVFFTPFTQSRFGLTVRPFITRLGVEQDNCFKTKEYVFLRRTDDNRSENLGQISQIYEDNVQITGTGIQVSPFVNLPIVGFIEAGTAYDLVYRNRDRWRGDLRGGLMYYQDFGTRPSYYDQLKISHDYYSDWYADTTYFSRYNNNVIGGIRTHQGIRLLQYHASLVNLYVVGRALADSNRDFFNNIAEVGPGIALVPTDRFNLQLRFEHIKGMYIPAGATPNPYGKYYTNNIVQLLFYVKI